jgi:hypothetical protein
MMVSLTAFGHEVVEAIQRKDIDNPNEGQT